MRVLLDTGAAELEPLDRGHWPLMTACQHGSLRAVDMLVSAQPNIVHARDSKGVTAMMVACAFGQDAIVRRILRAATHAGFSHIARMDRNGRTAMDYAILASSHACIQELIVAGVCFNVRSAVPLINSGDYEARQGVHDVRHWIRRMLVAHPTFHEWTTAHMLCVLPEACTRAALRASEGTLRLAHENTSPSRTAFLLEPSPVAIASACVERQPSQAQTHIASDESESDDEMGGPANAALRAHDISQSAAASRLVLAAAAAAWSPEAHALFPIEARQRAWSLVKLVHLLCADETQHAVWRTMSAWWWVRKLGPHLILRCDPIATVRGTIG